MFNKVFNFVRNNGFCVHLWSLSLVLLQFSITSTQGLSQSFERTPDPDIQRLRGQTLQIPCVIRSRQGNCQWLRNSAVIGPIRDKYSFESTPSNGDCSLTIQSLNPANDDGLWQCQVTAASVSESGLSSPFSKLTVLVAPNRPQLKSDDIMNEHIKLAADRSHEIVCQSEGGNPLPHIEWYIGGENVTQNSRSILITKDKPSITSYLNHTFKRSHQNSTIICLSIHPTINQNVSTIIDILYPPEVSIPQNTYVKNEGDELRVPCLIDANPQTRAIWKTSNIDPKEIKYDGNAVVIDGVSKNMNKALFECTAKNDFGNSPVASFQLDVLYEPQIRGSSDPDQTVELGDSIRLFCDYDGNPSPIIKWYQINPITNSLRNRPNDESNASNLVIENATYHDEGDYYCEGLSHNILTNRDFGVRSSKMVVNVIGKPYIIQNPGIVNGYRSANTDVEQLFCSDPSPTAVYWKFGSYKLETNVSPLHSSHYEESNYTKALRHKPRPLIALDKPKSTCFRAILSIHNTDITDQRDYTLVVENLKGSVESLIRLKVNSPISAAIMITIGLIVLIMLFALTLVTLLVIKRRKLSKEKADDESKAEARAPMKSDVDKPEKEPEKEKGDNHELVYANLDFAKPESKPPKSKPQAQQRLYKSNGGNSNTEYAQITFANKADL